MPMGMPNQMMGPAPGLSGPGRGVGMMGGPAGSMPNRGPPPMPPPNMA
jgi:hypothetical protein